MVDPLDANYRGREVKSDVIDRLMTELLAIRARKLLPKLTPKPQFSDKGSLRAGLFAVKNKKLAEFIFTPTGENVRVWSSVEPDRVFEIEKSIFESFSLDIIAPKPNPAPTAAEPRKAKGNPCRQRIW